MGNLRMQFVICIGVNVNFDDPETHLTELARQRFQAQMQTFSEQISILSEAAHQLEQSRARIEDVEEAFLIPEAERFVSLRVDLELAFMSILEMADIIGADLRGVTAKKMKEQESRNVRVDTTSAEPSSTRGQRVALSSIQTAGRSVSPDPDNGPILGSREGTAGSRQVTTEPFHLESKVDLSKVLLISPSETTWLYGNNDYQKLEDQKKLSALLGGDGERYSVARLIEEPMAINASRSVGIEIDGYLCGYLLSRDIFRVKPLLEYANRQEKDLYAVVKLTSKIYELNEAFGLKDDWGFKVAISVPWHIETIFPINSIPEDVFFWPSGGKVGVSTNGFNSEVIPHLLRKAYVSGICGAYFELKVFEDQRSKHIVQVFSDGIELGRMSPQASKKFGPAISKLTDSKRCFAYAIIQGNSFAFNVNLSMPTPDRLSSDALTELGLA
jgi:hypothetical protein